MYEGQGELRIPLPAEIQEGFMEEVALELCPAGGGWTCKVGPGGPPDGENSLAEAQRENTECGDWQ